MSGIWPDDQESALPTSVAPLVGGAILGSEDSEDWIVEVELTDLPGVDRAHRATHLS